MFDKCSVHVIISRMEVYKCSKCGRVGSADEFRKDRRRKTGVASWCLDCHRLALRKCSARRRNAIPRDELRAIWREDYYRRAATNPEWKPKRFLETEEEKVAARREADKRWYWNNQEKKLKSLSDWRKSNKDKVRDQCATRRARMAAGPVERIRRADIWTRDGGVCHICGDMCDPNKWELDHVIPLSRGGTHTVGNVAVSHPSCNKKKWTHIITTPKECSP